MSEWISVEDRLPSGRQQVVTYTPDMPLEKTYRHCSGEFVKVLTDATHWMLLAPPTQDKPRSDKD